MAQAAADHRNRCGWVSADPDYIRYHDREWGVPSRDDRHLFEMLILEGAQAGLSWLTVLRKRERYRERFHGFDPEKVAAMTDQALADALTDPGIIRNRLKVHAARRNARAFLELTAAEGAFSEWLWAMVDGRPVIHHWRSLAEVPTTSTLSDRLSRELRRRGFTFVGSTICYAYLQAVGVVMDHTVDCFRHAELTA